MDISMQEERENLLFLCISLLFQTSGYWRRSIHSDDDGSFLLSLQIQMLISSGNALTEISRSNVSPALWASLNAVMLVNDVDHQKGPDKGAPQLGKHNDGRLLHA